MKFTLGWLKEYLDTNASLNEICVKLVDLGLEVESVIDRSKDLEPFIVAEIIEAEKHPEADRLKVCKVNNGKEILQIVCGAPNARAGIKVVLAEIDTIIPNGKFQIKKSKIRGVESCGMMCSSNELGVTDEDTGTIIELDDSAIIGSRYLDISGFDDPVIELSITPNRGDCLGVFGIARDLAATGIGKLKKLEINQIAGALENPIQVSAEDQKLCPLFLGRFIKNIKNVESPKWLQNRLNAIGLKPNSALVDITNYISYSFGRPLHVYDADKLSGNLVARLAKNGETLMALNNKEYKLDDTMLIIADNKGPQAIAGIIGGLDSSVTKETKNILLEVALFDAEIVAKTGRKLQITSDARYRFERHVDHHFPDIGELIAANMIRELCGGEFSQVSVSSNYVFKNKVIEFNYSKIEKLAAISVEKNIAKEILSALGFVIEDLGQDRLKLTVPSWRNDIEGEADIVEEVGRIYGFNHIKINALPGLDKIANESVSFPQRRIRDIRRAVAAKGYDEVVSFSFMDSKKSKYFAEINNDLVLKNPISSELDVMRATVIPNLLDMIVTNKARGFSDIALFEVGPEFHGVNPNDQRKVIAGIRAGKFIDRNIHRPQRDVDFFDIKADMALILRECGLNMDRVKLNRSVPKWYHPSKAAAITLGKNVIGYFGEIHPKILDKFDIKQKVMGFEFYPDNVPTGKAKQTTKQALDISDFQAVHRDFAFIMPKNIEAEVVVNTVMSTDKNLVKQVGIFDIYTGKNIDEDKKSVAFYVVIQAKDRTLNDKDIEELSAKIITNIEKATGGKLR